MANAYTNPGGQGDRRALITVTTDIIAGAGVVSNLVDGLKLGSGHNYWWNDTNTGHQIKFDFGTPRNITEAIWTQSPVVSSGTWKWQGSNDNTLWTDIGGTFILGSGLAQIITVLSVNINYWRYYRMLQLSGIPSNSPWLDEIEFSIDDGTGPPLTGRMKTWNGSAWTTKPVKVWNGSAWVTKPIKAWNGSTWI